MNEKIVPIHKFNNGRGATLCHECRVIILEGLTQDLYCKDCKVVQDYYKQMEKEVHFNRGNLNK